MKVLFAVFAFSILANGSATTASQEYTYTDTFTVVHMDARDTQSAQKEACKKASKRAKEGVKRSCELDHRKCKVTVFAPTQVRTEKLMTYELESSCRVTAKAVPK